MKFFFFRQLPALFQVGKFLIHLDRYDDVRDELHHELHRQIEDKVSGQHDEDDLEQRLDRVAELRPEVADIGFLVGQIDGVFIAQQIGADRVCHIHQIDEPQMLDAAAVLDEKAQKRHQCKAHEQHHDRHDTVEEPVKVHQLRQPMLVILRSRLIQAVYHRRADSKLCKVQDAQHIGEQSVDTQICRRQIVDEHHPADEQQRLIHELSTHIDDHIDEGIPCPHFSYIPSFSSVARRIRFIRVRKGPVRFSLLEYHLIAALSTIYPFFSPPHPEAPFSAGQ